MNTWNRKSANVISLVCCAMLSLMLAGCTDSKRSQIIGIWNIKTADKVLNRIATDDEDQPLPGSGMSLEFRRDGTLVTTTRMGSIEGKKEGTWEIIETVPKSGLPDGLVVRTKIGLQESETEVDFISDSIIKLVPPNMAGLTMKLEFERK